MKRYSVALAASLLAANAIPAQAAEFIVDGTFAGGLASWTPYTTTNGTATPVAASYNVTGLGIQTAAQLRAGVVVFSFGNPAQGGGLYQTATIANAGLYQFKVDFASEGTSNSSGGIFSLLVNDVSVTSFDTGSINGIERGNLTYQANFLPGTYKLSLQVARPFTPSTLGRQYFTNASFASVPEPMTWALLLLGFGMIGATLRKQPKVRVRFV